MKPPYEILIEIILFSGRTDRAKADLYKKIVEKLGARHSIKGETVFIILNEQPKENWGIRGGKPALEINFDFDIEI
ncbi:tautomerase family protein [Dysgonomonas sp. BGC7]|uniref:tautomerase family protein n=1 Tax=Dysgonomonas sp. BGC7 TaxID=1658008 RepID=UPI00067FC1F3|nr:tautomerase family protein [Dysgonomonas sp. BGC7]MBD8387111.1 tautomerase family protein [Dysgonomonas sp. BGC7]